MIQTIPNWLMKRANLTPDRTALIFKGKSFSFEDVYEQAINYAGKIESLPCHKDDFVAVLFSNQAKAVFVLYALQMLGIKAVILNNRLTAEELAWQLKDSNPKWLLYEKAFTEKIEYTSTPKLSLDELEQIDFKSPSLVMEYALDDVTSIMYTSGTTGNPKGVLQTYGNHWWSATASALNLGIHESDRWLCAVPIFHISGYSILMRGLMYGMTVVLHDTFDEKMVIEEIRSEGITMMSVVSTMLQRILDALEGEGLPESFRCMLLGGGPAPLSMLEKCKMSGIPIFQTYGMTETASQFATLSPEDSLEKLGSAGKALFPNQIKIVDENGVEQPPGREGEIIVKGPNVTAGYLNREDATTEALRDSWLYTGDIGMMDKDGFLFVLDRRSDLIISGGENIYPAEIEGVLLSHEGIEDAGVVGIQDETWGQIPIAFVVRTKNTISVEELSSFCEEKLARYKIPKQFYVVDQLPRNASRKLIRRQLREWAGKTGDWK